MRVNPKRAGLLILLILAACWPGSTPLLSFTGTIEPCMTHEACATFSWETRDAQNISLQSGYVEDGEFHAGGWYAEDDLPASGSVSFRIKIDNYAAQLCVQSKEGTVCAVCNPFEPKECRAPR